jgi:hypothetical protein
MARQPRYEDYVSYDPDPVETDDGPPALTDFDILRFSGMTPREASEAAQLARRGDRAALQMIADNRRRAMWARSEASRPSADAYPFNAEMAS